MRKYVHSPSRTRFNGDESRKIAIVDKDACVRDVASNSRDLGHKAVEVCLVGEVTIKFYKRKLGRVRGKTL
jgi:hypothetical protein